MPPTQDAAAQASAAEPKVLAGEGVVFPSAVAGTRIDPAHTLGQAVPPPISRPGASADSNRVAGPPAELGLADGPAQIEAQAAQLAALLDQRQRELDQRETQIDRREAALAQEIREARFRLSQRRRQIDQRQTARQGVLRRQSERLDRRRAALEASRRQAAQMRQEALELRLVTEELHARLIGQLEPAALSASLGRLRQCLTDHYREEAQELTRRRAELELLMAELAEQYEKLRRLARNDGGHGAL